MVTSCSCHCSSTMMMMNTRLIHQLSFSLSQSLNLTSLSNLIKVLSQLFCLKNLYSNLRLTPQNNPFYSYKETLAKKRQKHSHLPISRQNLVSRSLVISSATALRLWTKWSTDTDQPNLAIFVILAPLFQ